MNLLGTFFDNIALCESQFTGVVVQVHNPRAGKVTKGQRTTKESGTRSRTQLGTAATQLRDWEYGALKKTRARTQITYGNKHGNVDGRPSNARRLRTIEHLVTFWGWRYRWRNKPKRGDNLLGWTQPFQLLLMDVTNFGWMGLYGMQLSPWHI